MEAYLPLIHGARLVFDTAALTLIWLVQLVIYPAFAYYARNDLLRWHVIYTRRVTYVVLPVMLGQLGVYLVAAISDPSWQIYVNLLLVAGIWLLTFLKAVPLHAAVARSEDPALPARQLEAINWWRTAGWTLVWFITILL